MPAIHELKRTWLAGEDKQNSNSAKSYASQFHILIHIAGDDPCRHIYMTHTNIRVDRLSSPKQLKAQKTRWISPLPMLFEVLPWKLGVPTSVFPALRSVRLDRPRSISFTTSLPSCPWTIMMLSGFMSLSSKQQTLASAIVSHARWPQDNSTYSKDESRYSQ